MNKNLHFFIILFLFLTTSTRLIAQGSGNALKLDGFNGYVLSSTSNRGITNQVTLEAWVKTTAFKYQWVAGKYDRYGAERGYHLIIKDGKAAIAGRDNSGIYRNSGYSGVTVSDGEWHHLAGVCDGKNWLIYVDGVLQSSSTTNYANTSLVNNAPFAIGKYFLVDNEYYVGQIDEVKLWKKALSEEEIRQNMCSKLSSSPSDLVAYFNFDAAGSRNVEDLSMQQLDGTIQNQSASTSWIVSGAPIGDKSVYRYTNKWDASLEMVTDNANFSVKNVDPAIQGFHLYSIQSPPSPTNGIDKPQDVQEYYGLFKVGDASKKYKVYYKNYNLACGGKLFRRQDNADTKWTQVADTVAAPIMLYTSSANYGEFAASSQMLPPLPINGPNVICAGSTGTISIPYSGNGQIKWNTGETSSSISIKRGGRYEVTVTEGSCIRTNSIEVRESSPFVFSLTEDENTCGGQPKTLTAPAGMAAYKWSTGETSASIIVSRSGNYWVEVTNNSGCTASDEISVTVNEEPEIPLEAELNACFGEQVMLDATVPGATYLWSTGQSTPTINVIAPAKVNVVITINGCSYTRQATVSSDECPLIPNIITPNGDGKNDQFVVGGIEKNTLELKIFNRWGKSVYQSDRYDNSWSADGAPAGVYYYQFTSSRTSKVYKGWLEVIR